MINIPQFRAEIVDPALRFLDLWSPAASALVLGTAIQESALTMLRQTGGGPARGVFQIEPATHDDLWMSFLRFRPAIAERLTLLLAPAPDRDEQLVTNLLYAAAVCRLLYFRRPEKLPDASDVDGLAAYWKLAYNTPGGAGAAAQWAFHYRSFVA